VEASVDRNNVLVQLESLQDDLLERLDDLDRRVCLVLKEWTTVRGGEMPVSRQDSRD
jgi:hypothetical protein